jgi:hypothetical protein
MREIGPSIVATSRVGAFGGVGIISALRLGAAGLLAAGAADGLVLAGIGIDMPMCGLAPPSVSSCLSVLRGGGGLSGMSNPWGIKR